jgi:lysophospholipase L1-like esterase
MRNRKEGYRLYTSELSQWASQDQQWLKDDFERTEPLDVAASASNLSAIVGKIREQSESPILVYNMSPLVPGETLHCYQGMEETYSTRVRRFNLALIELSEKTGISIVDVDSLLARKGADALKLDPLHLTAAGYRLVAEEVVRILEDVGVLDEEASVYAS